MFNRVITDCGHEPLWKQAQTNIIYLLQAYNLTKDKQGSSLFLEMWY